MIAWTLMQLSLPQLGATCALHLASLLPASTTAATAPFALPRPLRGTVPVEAAGLDEDAPDGDATGPVSAEVAAPRPAGQDPGDGRLQRLPIAKELSAVRLAELRRQLSELRLALATHADHDAAWEGLQELIPSLLMPPPASAGLLEQRKLGLETLDTLLEVIAHRELTDRSRQTLLDTLAASAPEDEEVQLRVRSARERRNPDESDRIDAAVVAAIDMGNQAFLHELGSRAVPGLRQAFLRDPDAALPSTQHDALLALAGAYPLELSELVGETLDHTSFYYRRRVMRAIQNSRLTARSEGYAVSQGTPPPFLGEGFLRFFELHFDDPDIGHEVREEVVHLMRMDALTPRLEEALVRLGRDGDTQEIEQLVRMLQRSYPGPKVQRTLVRLLDEAQLPVRRAAATQLVLVEDVGPVLALAEDPDPELRRIATQALGRHRVYEMVPNDSPGQMPKWESESRYTPESPAHRAAALRLLRDERPDVRVLTLEHLRESKARLITHSMPEPLDGRNWQSNQDWNRQEYLDPLPAEVLLERVGDEAEGMRHQLLSYLGGCPLDTRYRVLRAVAESADPAERSQLASFLYDLPWWEHPQQHVAMLELLCGSPETGLTLTDRTLQGHLAMMRSFEVGVNVLAEWALRVEDDAFALELLNVRSGRGNRAQYGREWLMARPDLVPRLIARMVELDPKAAWDLARADLVESARRAALAAVTLAEPVEARLLAARLAFGGVSDAELVDALCRAVALPGWGTLDEVQLEQACEVMEDLVKMPGAELRNRLARAVLDVGTLPDDLAKVVLVQASYGGEDGTELGRRVLARYFEGRSGPSFGPTYMVLRAMAFNPDLRDMDVLHRAARLPGLNHNALSVLGDLRDPASLPVIAEVIRGTSDDNVLSRAAQALPGYLSDEAAELLLEIAAKAPEERLRVACLEQLDKIRAFQDARERWATRRVNVQTRDQVVSDLLGLLRDGQPRQRREAARALATWEAVEAMPELIRLLGDADPELAAAAGEALDRLNAVRVPEDAPAGEAVEGSGTPEESDD